MELMIATAANTVRHLLDPVGWIGAMAGIAIGWKRLPWWWCLVASAGVTGVNIALVPSGRAGMIAVAHLIIVFVGYGIGHLIALSHKRRTL